MLQLHRASRGDGLAEGLAEMLRQPAGDPFSPEIVSVPTRGVERWLTQRLSGVLGAAPGRGDGVCANVAFPFPATLVGAAVAAATGVDPDADPWAPKLSVWPLLRVVDGTLGEPWLAPLAAHLAGGGADAADRRFSTVRHLADLFDRYGVHRPGMLRDWAAGGGPPAGADGAWQAELWRRLRAAIGVPAPGERLADACARLSSEPELLDLPDRVSLFGLTRLPASYLDVLVAISSRRDVHLWLLHPSPAVWDRLAGLPAGVGPRRDDPTAALPANPLVRGWGRDAREMQLVLEAAGAHAADALADPTLRPTLLGRIQADIRSDRSPPGSPPPGGLDRRVELAPSDRSLQVHACHGRARQVEVLRDVVLHLLDADPTLEPRDVLVMCPDIETFAPLIQATFGPGREVDGAELDVRLADRSLRQTNPILGTLSRLLELASGRVTVSELLDLAGAAPVRVRFGFDDDSLARLDGWVRSAGVRWGVDARWRRPYRLESIAAGTWIAGLDRVLAGGAMSEDPLSLVGGVLPLDDVDSGDLDLAGRFAELVERAGRTLEALSVDKTAGEWVAALAAAADGLFASGPDDGWQRAQLDLILSEVAADAGAGGDATRLRPAELRSLLADRLRGVPTRANFRTGDLTACTLVPMRSVPHRVICLLGLDDGAFPRRIEPDGDDLLAADPWVGDRDPRNEDRQLLLDALLAAEDTLVVTYSGRDERTNSPRPPAVPVGELLDVVDRTARVHGRDAREVVVTRHPLQGFDERNFVPSHLIGGRPWSFDRSALEGAREARRPRSDPAVGVSSVLSTEAPDVVGLDELVQFVEHPVKAFLVQRLGIYVRSESVEPGDSLTLELDALEEWQVGDRLLAAGRGGRSLDDCLRAELARGTLPPGRAGPRALARIRPRVAELIDASSTPTREAAAIDVTAAAPGLPVVAGTVNAVYGNELTTVTYSRLGPKHRLGAWVRLVVLSASDPTRPWTARAIGRALRGEGVAIAYLGPLGSDEPSRAALADDCLARLLDLHLRGLREPLPLALKTSAAWAAAVQRGRDPEAEARKAWESNHAFPGEDRDAAHRFAFGGRRSWDELVAEPPGDGEAGPGWSDHPSRVGRLAERLWGRLLSVEVVR